MKTSSLITAAVVFHRVLPCVSKLVYGDLNAKASLGFGRAPSDGWKQMSVVFLGNTTHWSETVHDELELSSWHPRRVELRDLVPLESIQPHRLEIVQHAAEFGATPLLAKLAPSPADAQSLAHEATMYRRLYDPSGRVTPLFLGHVTVDGRIVGFLTEYIQPARGRSARAKGGASDHHHPPKVEACLTALRRLHTKGIAHGDAHGENCLVRSDGSAVLIDFELALETSAQIEFDRDLWIMTHTAGD